MLIVSSEQFIDAQSRKMREYLRLRLCKFAMRVLFFRRERTNKVLFLGIFFTQSKKKKL